MSRAVVTLPGSGRPCGLTKCDRVMPMRAASAFIRAENPAWLPPIVSATAMAMSLADFTIMMRMAFCSVSTVPGWKPILLGGSAAACALMMTGVSIVASPARMARKAT